MKKRVFLFVIDGFGVGASEDAKDFGDVGSNTFENINKKTPLNLPTLTKLGIKNIDGLHFNKQQQTIGAYGKLRELSNGKDTTTGHFELMGIIRKNSMPTFPNGFPKPVVDKLEKIFGKKILGNCVASGTEIIEKYGDEHLKTGSPIVYTSADSVLQIACHENVMPPEKLYDYCQKVRDVMSGKYAVGRVIARPFTTLDGKLERLNNLRKDFSLIPDKNNTMKKLFDAKKDVIAVGKISDIFAHQSITKDYPSHNNSDALKDVDKISKLDFEGLVFINLVDTDMLYGHRNDYVGYAQCLENTDNYLSKFITKLNDDDILIVTGDHGNDPTTTSSDHSREYTPILIYGKNIKPNVNLGTVTGFNEIGNFIEDYLLNNTNSLIGEKIWKK
ncbi:MAG: phosphopentomutase [Christensenellales bacterium]